MTHRVVAAVTVLAWAPILAVLLGMTLADGLGCAVDGIRPRPCLVGGHDMGGLLHTLFMAGYLGLLTLPFALGTAVFWVALAIRALWRRFR